jgi:hypothetical protein
LQKKDRIYKKITIKLYLFIYIYIYIYICIFVCIYICIYVYTSLLLGGEEKGDFPASAAAIVKAGSKQFNKEAVISIFPIRTSTGIFAKWYPRAVSGRVALGKIALMSNKHVTLVLIYKYMIINMGLLILCLKLGEDSNKK